MSQRAATRGFFLCISCTLAVLAAAPSEAQITFSPGTVSFGVGETSEVITATITYASTPPTGGQSLTFVGDSLITTIPTTVTFVPPTSPGSVNVQFQLVAAAPASTGTGLQFEVSTLGVLPAFLYYDLGPVGVTPPVSPVVAGATTGSITATMSWNTTPPGGTLELVVGGLPAGATTVPAPVTFASPTGWNTTVNFQIATTTATPVGSHTLTATTASLPAGVATFTLDVAPPPTTMITPGSASISVCRDGPAVANSVTITATGYTGQANVNFIGLPTGLSISPSTTIPVVLGAVPTTVNFDVSADVDAIPGPNTVVVEVLPLTGPAATTSFTVNVSGGDYTPLLSPASLTLFPGGDPATVMLGATPAACPPPGGFLWVIPGTLPAGITMNPSEPYLEAPYDSIAVTFSASASTNPGTYSIVFPFVTDDIPTKMRTLTVVVKAPGALTAEVEKASVDACPGGAAVENSVTVTPIDGFEGSAEVTFPFLPAELVIAPTSIPLDTLPPSRTVTFGVSARPDATPGPKVVVVRAASPFGVATVATFTVNVAALGFTPAFAPAALELIAGGEAEKVVVSLASSACPTTAETILVTPSGLPAGVTVTPGSAVLFGPTYPPVEFTFVAASSVAAGTTTATFAFEPSDGAARTVPFPIAVQRPGSLTIVAERSLMELCAGGGPAPNTLTVNGFDGYAGTPTVTFPGLPAGLTATPATIEVPGVPPAQVVSFTLQAAAGLAAGDHTVTVKVADPKGTEATTTVVARVLPPGFVPTVNPSPLLLNARGAAGTMTASLNPGSCPPSTDVTITPSGLPPDVVVTPTSAVLSPPDFLPALFTFLAGAGAEPGSFTITFTWEPVGASPQTTTATITVCGPPAAPGSPTIRPAGNPQGPVTATDFLDLSWEAPTSGFPATRYDWRINGGTWNAAAGTSAIAPPRGAVDPVQLFVRAYACDPEEGPGAEASSPVYSLEPPQASFAVPASVIAGQPAAFTDASSPQATSWLWFPGDGMPVTTFQSPTVTFPSAGPQVVVLVATNGSGTSTKSTTVNVLPASAVRTGAGSFARRLDRQADGRLALDGVDVVRGTALLLRRLAGEGDSIAFLRFVDPTGATVVERRLVLAAGEEARHELSAFGEGSFRIELVGPEGLEATVVTTAVPTPAPELPAPPRELRRIEPR